MNAWVPSGSPIKTRKQTPTFYPLNTLYPLPSILYHFSSYVSLQCSLSIPITSPIMLLPYRRSQLPWHEVVEFMAVRWHGLQEEML